MGTEGTATVRLFAALRDAAGTGSVTVPAPVPLRRLLADLADQMGERFAARLPLAAVMVDGTPADLEDDVVVDVGSEVALLPPFAGGALTYAGGSTTR